MTFTHHDREVIRRHQVWQRNRNRRLFKKKHPTLRASRVLEQPVRIRIVMEFK